jgi:glycosyltransferase involved in cell wall biosynthesis
MTIATADYVKEKLIENGRKKEKIRVIINGSVGLRKLTKAEKSEARKRLGYSDEDFLVGIIGRLEHGKGQEIFIEAARLCPSRRIKFLVVGSG